MAGIQVSPDELAQLLFKRTKESGLIIRPDLTEKTLRVPALPDGVLYELHCANANGHHRCEDHRLVRIPLVLVVELVVPEIIRNAENELVYLWQAKEKFEPYWLTDVCVIHDWVPYPNRAFRSLNAIEAACVFAQQPHLGSIQCHFEPRSWGHGRFQIYRSPDDGIIIASRYDIPSYNHHTAFTTGLFGLNGPALNFTEVTPSKQSAQGTKTQPGPEPAASDQAAPEAPSSPPPSEPPSSHTGGEAPTTL